MHNIKKYLPVLVLVAALLILQCDWAFAQCPMCRAAAEANIKEGGKHALGLNAGILYLFVAPYLIVATIGFLWWRNHRKVAREEQALNNNNSHASS
ncbi:hypothetical protein C7N43_31875 [Sphingobacteriales bacterium UPWRP_1]|nr:hypothetical protein C7N43_31875 [Sphingobacteriales bacterium UPWRP_1]